MLSASRRRTPARVIAETYLLSGPVSTLAAACAAGGIAIASAFLQIQGGRAEVMLAGGTDSVAQVPYAGFSSLNVLTDDRVRPFDRNRSGFLIGEGAGMLILETLQNAQRRKAHIYAEIRGFGISADAYHVVHPHPEAKGLISAIRKALEMASCHADAVDYINAHGTATSANDKAECLAMSAALNREKRNVCTSSFKAVLGHTMGAAGAIETVGCILALRNQCIPPTWNFQEVDPECNVDCVPNLPRAARLGMILKNSSGFGGSNCCLALSAC
jgi:3-oxoacyl-[acyl-carrier-protein] synthase II